MTSMPNASRGAPNAIPASPAARRMARKASLRGRLSPRTRTGPARATGRNSSLVPAARPATTPAAIEPASDSEDSASSTAHHVPTVPASAAALYGNGHDPPTPNAQAAIANEQMAAASDSPGASRRASRRSASTPRSARTVRHATRTSRLRPSVRSRKPSTSGGKRAVGIADIAVEHFVLRRVAAPCSSRAPSPRTAGSSA